MDRKLVEEVAWDLALNDYDGRPDFAGAKVALARVYRFVLDRQLSGSDILAALEPDRAPNPPPPRA